jgi:rubrerythrin
MIEKTDEMVAIVTDAIGFEKAGRDFFLQAVKRVKADKTKAMLQSLADDEVRHLQRLEAEHGALLQTGDWSGLEHRAARIVSARDTIFPIDSKVVKQVIKPSTDELEILRLGVKQENKGYAMYTDAAEKAKSPAGKALFQWLAAEELAHMELMSNSLQFLENPDEFFLLEERPNFEG